MHMVVNEVNKISVTIPSVRKNRSWATVRHKILPPQIRSKTMALSESAQLGQCHLATWQQEPQGELGKVNSAGVAKGWIFL